MTNVSGCSLPSMYTRGKTTGLGKYNVSDVVHSLGGGPDTFISDVKRFSKGPGIVISLVHSTLPQQQDKILILLSFYGSHTTIANN